MPNIDRFSKYADSAVKFACFNLSVTDSLMQIYKGSRGLPKNFMAAAGNFSWFGDALIFFGSGASRFRLAAAAGFGG